MKRKDDGIDVEGRLPGFFLYPADLERELQPLPVGAQGVWIRMLLRMHWAPRRGYLEHPTGKAFTEEDISRMVGHPRQAIANMLYDMEHRYGTFSRDENGVIFNRRMVRDTEISLKRKAAGKQGGNPLLIEHLDKQNPDLVNQVPNQNGIRGYTRARGSSSSSSSAEAEEKSTTCPPDGGPVVEFALAPVPTNGNGAARDHHSAQAKWFEAWWAIYWRRVSRKSAEKAFFAKVKTLNRFEEVMRATKAQTSAMMAREPDRRPHGATWLNAERWNDEPSQPAKNGPGRAGSFTESVTRAMERRVNAGMEPL